MLFKNLSQNTKAPKFSRLSVILALGSLMTGHHAHASTAFSEPYSAKQCGGGKVTLYLRGSAERNWEEDDNGYTIIRTGECIDYAMLDTNGGLVSSGKRVGVDKAPVVKKHLKPKANELFFEPKTQILNLEEMRKSSPPQIEKSRSDATTIKNLVILIRFADHTEQAAQQNGYSERRLPTAEEFDVLFNKPGGDEEIAPVGSIRDIYLANSYGQLSLESTIVEWYTSPETESYWANGRSGLTSHIRPLLRAALDNADKSINFEDFDQDNDGYIDAVTFVHSGYGAEWGRQDCYTNNSVNDRIWSHKSNLGTWESDEGVRVSPYNINPALWSTCNANIGRVGVIAHELGHFFGLPDLYDGTVGSGIGAFGMMGNSWGSDGSQTPPLFSAWSRLKLGFNEPIELTVPGKYLLNDNTIYRVASGYPDQEHLLIEKRQRKTVAQSIVLDNIPKQGDGVAVWHIDERVGNTTEGHPAQNGWPENGNHYKVALLQADGEYELERGRNSGDRHDLYSANGVSAIGPNTLPNTDAYQDGNIRKTNHTISDISTPANEMTFCFNQLGCEGFELTVENGTGSGKYAAGETVMVTADETPNEFVFDGWVVSDGSTQIESSDSFQASINIMPANATVQAVFKQIKYAVTINNGTGSGSFAAGDTVSISANDAAEEQVFDRWVVVEGDAKFDSDTSANTNLEVVSGGAIIEATYRSTSEDSGGSVHFVFLMGLWILGYFRDKRI